MNQLQKLYNSKAFFIYHKGMYSKYRCSDQDFSMEVLKYDNGNEAIFLYWSSLDFNNKKIARLNNPGRTFITVSKNELANLNLIKWQYLRGLIIEYYIQTKQYDLIEKYNKLRY